MNALLYQNGICLDMGSPFSKNDSERKKRNGKKGGKRGNLTGKFSIASFRRLRQYCITHDVEGTCWGVTLTVPGLDIVPSDTFKSLIHKLGVFCNGYGIPLIWRCELQRRGQPHLHLVVYTDAFGCCHIIRQWHGLVSKLEPVWNTERCGEIDDNVLINRAFLRGSQHMYDVQELHGDYRSWRYLVAHASKGKQEQQGWTGRQWGVVCRSEFKELSSQSIELEDREMYCIRRWVRRYSLRRIGKYGKHFILMSPKDLSRLVSYVKDDYFGAPF